MSNINPYISKGALDRISYIERDADIKLREEVKNNSGYIYFLAPRQSGKTSLINHFIEKLDENKYKTVWVDLTKFTDKSFETETAFNENFINIIYSAFNIKSEPGCSIDLKEALKKIVNKDNREIVIFVDEIDRMLECSFKDTWFGNIRHFFICRTFEKKLGFKRIQFVLSGATTINSLISKKKVSPFNVAEEVELRDLTLQQTKEIKKYLELGNWEVEGKIAEKIYQFSSGSVYLTQLILERLWDSAIYEKKRKIIEDDVEEIVNKIIDKSKKIVHFYNIYKAVVKDKEIHKMFIKAVEGYSLDNFDLEKNNQLKISGILNEKNSYRNRIYEKVFGENGPLSLFQNDIKKIVKIELEIADTFKDYKDLLLNKYSHLSEKSFGHIINKSLEIAKVYYKILLCIENSDKIYDLPNALQVARSMDIKDIVILGEPGTGKTLLLKYIMIMLLKGKGEEKLGLNSDIIPFYAPIGELSNPDEESFVDFIKRVCLFEKYSIPDHTFKTLLNNDGGIILLDGLDQVVDEPTRNKICKWIDKARQEFVSTSFIITSRPAEYKGNSRLGSNVLVLSIQDLSYENIERILKHWFEAVETTIHPDDEGNWKKKVSKDAYEIVENIRSSEYLKTLVVNPMILQILGLIIRSRGNRLPQNKIELYYECSEVLIEKWIKENKPGLELNRGETRRIFHSLALWLHKNKRYTAPKEDIENQLKEYLRHLEKSNIEPTSLFLNIKDRSDFFKMHGDTGYGFTHLIFQEFFAAEKIKNDRNIDILVENYENEWWKQVILLALAFDNPSLVEEFIERMPKTEHFKADKADIDLVVKVINEAPVKPIKPLVSALKDKDLPPESRQNVMRVFKKISEDKVGENKIVIDALEEMVSDTDDALADSAYEVLKVLDAADNIVAPYESRIIKYEKDKSEMVLIPSGSFLYGEQEDYKKVDSKEKPQHIINLPAFYIDLYPVTNRQFCLFLNETKPGIENLNKWIYLDGKSGSEKCRIIMKQGNYTVESGYEEHPVIYVTWFGANAFTNWVGKRLPSEQEWEKAARGTDGLIYPWGNNFEKGYCNSSESGILHTTAVKQFPKGKSPYGCLDMPGNVFEWTNSVFNNVGDKYVLRGGAWISDSYNCRCAFRNESRPNYMNSFIGFRCVKDL